VDTFVYVRVNKRQPIFIAPSLPTSPLSATYLDKLSAVSLKQYLGWHWQQPSDTVGNVGLRKHRAWYYHLNDTNNYVIIDSALWIQVSKARPTPLPANFYATYGDTLKSIDLSLFQPWVWKYPDTLVGNSGRQPHIAIVNPADTNNYENITQTVTVNVAKARPAFNQPPPLTATYGDMLYTVWLWDSTRTNLTDRDTCWHWTAPNVKVGNVGVHSHPAVFIPIDTNFYTTYDTLNVHVKKAKPNISLPPLLTAFVGDTLGALSLPARWLYPYEGGRLYGSWRWYFDDDYVGSRGYQMHNAVFTMEDTANWDTVQRLLNVFVAKRTEINVTRSAPSDKNPRLWVVDSCTTEWVTISFGTDSNARILYNKRYTIADTTLNVHAPNLYVLPYTLVTTVDSITTYKEDTLTIERRFAFKDVVHVKANKVLFVDNNPLNTGYRFVAYQWWCAGKPVGDGKQTYFESASGGSVDAAPLPSYTLYSVTLTTEEGKQINTCEGYATKIKTVVKVYPNPVSIDGSLTIEFPTYVPDEQFEVRIFSVTGAKLYEFYVNPDAPETKTVRDMGITMPGIYVLKSSMGETLFVVE
jgi:hypothetical protein